MFISFSCEFTFMFFMVYIPSQLLSSTKAISFLSINITSWFWDSIYFIYTISRNQDIPFVFLSAKNTKFVKNIYNSKKNIEPYFAVKNIYNSESILSVSMTWKYIPKFVFSWNLRMLYLRCSRVPPHLVEETYVQAFHIKRSWQENTFILRRNMGKLHVFATVKASLLHHVDW